MAIPIHGPQGPKDRGVLGRGLGEGLAHPVRKPHAHRKRACLVYWQVILWEGRDCSSHPWTSTGGGAECRTCTWAGPLSCSRIRSFREQHLTLWTNSCTPVLLLPIVIPQGRCSGVTCPDIWGREFPCMLQGATTCSNAATPPLQLRAGISLA